MSIMEDALPRRASVVSIITDEPSSDAHVSDDDDDDPFAHMRSPSKMLMRDFGNLPHDILAPDSPPRLRGSSVKFDPMSRAGSSRSSSPGRGRKEETTKPYNRIFATQYGGFSYMVNRKPAKSRYLDYEKGRRGAGISRKSMTHDEFTDMIEAGTRNNAMEFEAADEDMDNVLSFREFKNLVRSRMPTTRERSEPQLMAWYKALDTDGNGTLSMAEFFAFSLREAFLRANSGKTMQEFFKHWDRGGDGKLDRDEFIKLAERVGFGHVADELLAAVDVDGSGVIEYSEFVNMLRQNTQSGAAHSFLFSAARAEKVQQAKPLMLAVRRSSTDQQAMDMHAALQDELRDALVSNGSEVLDIFRAMDVDKNNLLSVTELNQALNLLELDVPAGAVQTLYEDIDRTVQDDPEGPELGLTVSEFNTWMLKVIDSKESTKNQLRDALRNKAGTVLAWFARKYPDKNAAISMAKLNVAIKELGFEGTEEAVGALFDDLDSDGSGYIAMPELKKWLETKLDDKSMLFQNVRDGLRSNGAKLMRIFNKWDYDNSGTIDVDELGRALKEIGFEGPREVIAKVFEELDRDHSNAITLQELNKYLLRKMHTKAQLQQQLKEGLRANGQRIIDLFRSWDLDGDALISEDEFAKGLHASGFRVPSKVVKKLFDELDADANYRLSFSELNAWLKSSDADANAPKEVTIEEPSRGKPSKQASNKSVDQSASTPAVVTRQPTKVFTRKKDKELKGLEKGQRNQIIMDNLMKRFPDKTEGEVRHALHKAKWQPGGAALFLEGKQPISSMAMQPKAKGSSRELALDGAPAVAAPAADDDEAQAADEDDGEEVLHGPQTPATIADAKRRQRHKEYAKGRTDAMSDLV